VGDKVLVPHTDRFYEGKVLKAQRRDDGLWYYLLHYTGNTKRTVLLRPFAPLLHCVMADRTHFCCCCCCGSQRHRHRCCCCCCCHVTTA
jgi:hypothetical protein